MAGARRATNRQHSRAPRCAIYTRVSSSLQEDNSSLDTQEAACRALAAERGWEVIAIEREVHTGADLFGRQRLAALRERIRNAEIDILVAYALDRLSRKQTHVAIVAEECDLAGARLAFVTEDFEDGPVGTFIRSAKAFAAELEREKIRERTQRGIRARVLSGKPIATAPPPYGLRWRDAEKSGCEVDPVTICTVRRIFDDYDGGLSLRQVALGLERDGILPPRHARTGTACWGLTSVRHILTERAYTGIGQAFRYRSEKGPGGHSVVRLRPDEERENLPAGTYPEVIDPALFERVQIRLVTNRSESMRSDRNPDVGILRRGFATCGICGHRLVVVYERGVPVYRCHVQNKRRHACPGVSMRVSALDAAAWSRVESILTNPSVVATEVERLRRDDPTSADLETIDRQLDGITRQQASVAQAIAMLDGNTEALSPLVAQMDGLGKQRQALLRERATMEARRQGWLAERHRLAHAVDYCTRIATSLQVLTFGERRLALEALGVNVQVFRSDCKPRWILTLSLPFQDVDGGASPAMNLFSSHGTTAMYSGTMGCRMGTMSSS